MLHSAPNDAWSRVLDELKGKVSEQRFQTWFKPIRPLEISQSRLILEVPNPFFVDWFEEHNLPLLRSIVSSQLGGNLEIRFSVAEDFQSQYPRQATATQAAEPMARPAPPNRPTPPTRSSNLNPRFTFDNFVVGRGNEFTYAAAKAVAAESARVYNPLFIHGGVGLGKTHLMQAIGWAFRQRTPSARISYGSAEKFMNEMIESIRRAQTIEFRERYRTLDLLLIDDIQFLSGKESTQEEFFHTFNSLYDANKQVVVTCDCAPKDIQDLEERLVSRFNWGLVTDIQPPDFETRAAILRHKAERDGIHLQDSVLFFVAENIRSNIRELEGSLVRLSALASLSGSPITLDLARDVLADYIRTDSVTSVDVADIQRVVAAHMGVSAEALRGRRRTSTIALARQVAMYLTKQSTTCTLVEIGRRFGNRDHSTVLYACARIGERVAADADFAALVTRMLTDLQTGDRPLA